MNKVSAMNKVLLILLASAAAIAGTAAFAQRERLPAECRQELIQLCRGTQGGFRQCLMTALPKLSDPCRKAIGSRGGEAPAGAVEYSYGRDPRQRLDLVRLAASEHAPLLLFIHGGGWSIGDKRQSAAPKAEHFTAAGWAFGSVNYRLVPDVTVEQQAGDIAAAIGWARAHAAGQGLDPNRIVLMGHSAGAHLAALVGTDPRYLAAAGVPISAIKGVVLLDGAGYDIAKQMSVSGNPVAAMYDAAFGHDPKRLAALSPTLHAAAPNVASWLILPVAGRADSVAQSNGLASGLKAAGAKTMVVPVPDSSHMKLNRGLGAAGDFATGEVDRFLASLASS